MRMFQTVLLAVLMGVSTPAHAEDLTAPSKVSEVTVYQDRAAVTRSVTLDIPQGASTVVFDNLPLALMSDSLRVEGKSLAKVIIGALESKTVSSADLAAPKERELNAKLETLRDQTVLLMADQSALKQKELFLRNLAVQVSQREGEKIAALNLKPEEWVKSGAMIETSMKETLRAWAAKDIELREVNKTIAAVQEELNNLQTGAKASIHVRVPVESNQAGKLTLNLSYQMPNVGWSPLYDARLDTKTGRINLVQYGNVYQRTGEDWKNVKLTLSTAQPARGAALPPLHPMWVNFMQSMRYSRDMKKTLAAGADFSARSNITSQVMMESDGMADKAEMMAAPVPQDATFAEATLKSNDYVAEYDIAGESTIPADGSARKVMIGALNVESKLVAKIKPQIDPASAYLVAVTKLAGEAPLLAGTANLFRDGAFVGSLHLPFLRAGEETDLGFGIDDQVVVKTRLIKDESGEMGVIAKDNTRVRQTIVELENLHTTAIQTATLQTVPAPKDKDITFVLDKAYTTEGYDENVDKITGQLRWKKELKPKEKWEIKLGWELSWPKDKQINGLPF